MGQDIVIILSQSRVWLHKMTLIRMIMMSSLANLCSEFSPQHRLYIRWFTRSTYIFCVPIILQNNSELNKVSNIAPTTTKEQLRDFFTYVPISCSSFTCQSARIGFVERKDFFKWGPGAQCTIESLTLIITRRLTKGPSFSRKLAQRRLH
jgi:hypothetical protein